MVLFCFFFSQYGEAAASEGSGLIAVPLGSSVTSVLMSWDTDFGSPSFLSFVVKYGGGFLKGPGVTRSRVVCPALSSLLQPMLSFYVEPCCLGRKSFGPEKK